jgi:hypothetical protein
LLGFGCLERTGWYPVYPHSSRSAFS